MKWLSDWKYVLGTAVAAAGVIVPVYLWRADVESHSLTVRTVSRTPLQPKEASGVRGLRVLVDDKELTSASLLVFEVKNTGLRPIPAAYFEGPIEIGLGQDAPMLRAQVTSVDPKDIRPTVIVENGLLKLTPLLLNPGDAITIAVIAEKGSAAPIVRARIAGIASVKLEDDSRAVPSKGKTVGMAVFVLFAFLAGAIADVGFRNGGVKVKPMGAVLIYAVCMLAGVVTLMALLDTYGQSSFSALFASSAGLVVITSMLSMLLRFSSRVKELPPTRSS